MKIPTSRSDAFVAKPDPAARAVLLYGPDSGLVRERAERLALSVVEDLGDPFRVVELGPAQLRDDPARLADEAAQMALMGGRRVVRLRDAGEASAAPLAAFLEAPVGDALVVVEAGELSARSKLRALFEAADNAAALACYADTEESLSALVRETLRSAGLTAAPEALDYLSANLGGDRMVTRRELEKLVLYMGGHGNQVRLEDVEASIGDSAQHSLEDAVLAAAEGDARTVERALARAFAEGETPVGAVRAAQRYFQRLHLAAGQVALGSEAERAVDTLKPRLFWKVRPRFLAQLKLWPAARVAEALARLTAAEIACKSTAMPDEAIAVRCLLELAGSALRRRRSA
ncbi:MAG: DNA polymerase III subunit delta [Alphaproteobacteria bacterium]